MLNGLLNGRHVEFISSAGKRKSEHEVYITVNAREKAFFIRLCTEAEQCGKIAVLLKEIMHASRAC